MWSCKLGRTTPNVPAGYLDAPAALACPWSQSSGASLPAVCLVFCAVEGHAAMKVALFI